MARKRHWRGAPLIVGVRRPRTRDSIEAIALERFRLNRVERNPGASTTNTDRPLSEQPPHGRLPMPSGAPVTIAALAPPCGHPVRFCLGD